MAKEHFDVTIKVAGFDEFMAQLELMFNATYELQIAGGTVEGPARTLPCTCLTFVTFNGLGPTGERHTESGHCLKHTIWAESDPICKCEKYGLGFIHCYKFDCPIHGWPRHD